MPKYKVTIHIETEVEADEEYDAIAVWENNLKKNKSSIETEIIENMKIKEIPDKTKPFNLATKYS